MKALLIGSLIVAHTATCAGPAAEPMREGAAITLRDHLNRNWQNETIHYDLAFAKGEFPHASLALANDRGAPVPTQLESPTLFADGSLKTARLWFQASVQPFSSATWVLKAGVAHMKPPPPLLSDLDEEIVLENARVGIALRKRLKPGEGPITRIRLHSGKWVGGSSLSGPYELQPLQRRRPSIRSRGARRRLGGPGIGGGNSATPSFCGDPSCGRNPDGGAADNRNSKVDDHLPAHGFRP